MEQTGVAGGLVLLAASVLLWSWLVTGLVAKIILTNKTILFAIIAVIASIILFMSVKDFEIRDTARVPIPCGKGADFDTRDSLCYKNGSVPLEFQR
jgi:hypothetical protein